MPTNFYLAPKAQLTQYNPAFNHGPSSDSEAEYDRLRDLARHELSQKQSLSSKSQEAYQNGDGARAKQLSDQAKAHGHKVDDYNRQASEYIFRENNAAGRVSDDTIDLHGQFVEEAEDILRTRIRAAQQQGQTHLHVIVGKGNHSVNHIQKIKPCVEQLCQELGLAFQTEHNEGRIYVDLTGAQNLPEHPPQPGQGYHGGQQHGGQHGGQQHGGQSGYQRPPQQQQEDELEKLAEKLLPKLFKELGKCCIVM